VKIKLAYGRDGLVVDLPENRITVIEPHFTPGLEDEGAHILAALRHPMGTQPLRHMVSSEDDVAIVFSDLTRPMPNDRVLPVVLEEISHVPHENVVLINALGTHRPNTEEELAGMLGQQVVDSYRIIQHDCLDQDGMVNLGVTQFGHEIWVNRAYMDAKIKILTGFIEPHFFAGFSGGPKAVLPGIAGEVTILGNHSASMIGHPSANWGITAGNPLWEEIYEVAEKTHPDFILNVTLNRDRDITGVFAGEMKEAHLRGTEFARSQAMVSVDEAFDIVITTNAGYPLDLNLYQTVKGMSAAAQIVKPGGAIIAVAECWDGIPSHGEYKNLLANADSPQDLLDTVNQPDFFVRDQWEAQAQALIQLKADVHLKSGYLSDEEIRGALLNPCLSVEETVDVLTERYGPDASICVLPEGPLTIPVLTPDENSGP
jgi:nickel-dependent lactate racemase